MIELNTLLPMELSQAADKYDFQVIQIATDCVFSGERGQYVESSPHDANDLYGVTKSLGEIHSKRYMNLRCSIIGNEVNSSHSLHDWFLGNSVNSTVTGFTNHFWNGVTTVSFARIVSGIIKADGFSPGTSHIVPADLVSKYDLLKLIGAINDRGDITVEPFENEIGVDRTLNTNSPQFNETLWSWAGYEGIPSIQEMITEMDLTSG
jgi:dTDP-4-dehydrorhamnose reductase